MRGTGSFNLSTALCSVLFSCTAVVSSSCSGGGGGDYEQTDIFIIYRKKIEREYR